MYVVTPGFMGEAPMPRNRGLLSLRALNSVKIVFGAWMAASFTVRIAALSRKSRPATVALSGRLSRS